MPVIREDTFAAASIAGPPDPPWVTHIPTGGAVEIAADPQAGGTHGKVLKIAEGVGSTSDYSEAKLPLPAKWSKLVFVCEVYPLQGSKTLYFGFYAGGTRYDVLKLATDGTVKYKRGSDSTWVNFGTVVAYTANVAWQRIRIVLDRTAGSNELVMMTKDGVDAFSGSGLDLPAIPSDIDAVALATDSTEDNCTFYVANVQVMEKSAQITGVARDQHTALIPGARCVFLRAITGVALGTALSDAHGVYSFTVDAGIHVGVICYNPSSSASGGAFAPWVWAGCA